jgi:hypothetical protein
VSISFEQLKQEAAKLPEAQRAELAAELLRSLDPPADDDDPAEIERLWILEAKRRSEAVARGEAVTIPGDQVFAELRERYG